jgi:hypothetical protein
LICEDITKNNKSACAQIESYGFVKTNHTIFYDNIRKSLFVGDSKGQVIQYQQKENPLSWGQVKHYGNLKIGSICSSEQIGDVLVLEGSRSCFKAIDCVKKVLLSGRVTTAKESIYSLHKCELPGERVLLAVSGDGQYYSQEETDIYEVSQLAKAFNYDFQNKGEIRNKEVRLKDKKKKEKVNVKTQNKKNPHKETTSTEHTLCGCDSRKMMDVLITKLEHYLEVFTETMVHHFKGIQSRFSTSSRYKHIKLLINRTSE